MFTPAFRLALERTLHEDITPEALEAVFRSSMRKITEAKKCRTGVNLGKNLLIAKIMHKTRNIIIAAKKEQEALAASASSTTIPSAAVSKSPLHETRGTDSVPTSLPTSPASIRPRPPPLPIEAPAGDENVAPTPVGGVVSSLPSSPRPLKRSSTWCGAESSAFWTSTSPPASKVARMEVDESRDDQPSSACLNCRSASTPSLSTSVTTSSSSPSAQGHLHHHFHQQQNHLQPHTSPPPSPPPALWTFCAKEQSSPSPVLPALYSPYPQRMSLPLTTCPI